MAAAQRADRSSAYRFAACGGWVHPFGRCAFVAAFAANHNPIADHEATKKNVVIFVLVASCLAGIYWFSTPAERDRWLAVLGLSEEASIRVSEELAQRKRKDEAGKEAARARTAATAAEAGNYAPARSGDVCQSYREQAQHMPESGQAPDDHRAAKIAKYCDYR